MDLGGHLALFQDAAEVGAVDAHTMPADAAVAGCLQAQAVELEVLAAAVAGIRQLKA